MVMRQRSRVLVLDEDRVIVDLIERRLVARGFEVSVFSRGLDVVDRLNEFDICIMDVVLPDVDGLDILRIWTERGVQHPMILISEVLQPEEMEAALQAGAWAALLKPFAMETLICIIERHDLFCATFKLAREVGRQVRTLKRQVMILSIVVAALGGTQVIMPLIKLLAGG